MHKIPPEKLKRWAWWKG